MLTVSNTKFYWLVIICLFVNVKLISENLLVIQLSSIKEFMTQKLPNSNL